MAVGGAAGVGVPEAVQKLQPVAAQLLLPGSCHLQLGCIAVPAGAAVESGLFNKVKVAAPDWQAWALRELSKSTAQEGRLRCAVRGGVDAGNTESVPTPAHAQADEPAIC